MQMFKSKYTQELYYFFENEWYILYIQTPPEKCDFQVLTRVRLFLPGADKADFLLCHLHFQITHYMIEAADVSHFRHGGLVGGGRE